MTLCLYQQIEVPEIEYLGSEIKTDFRISHEVKHQSSNTRVTMKNIDFKSKECLAEQMTTNESTFKKSFSPN